MNAPPSQRLNYTERRERPLKPSLKSNLVKGGLMLAKVVYNTKEVCEILRMSRQTLMSWIRDGRIKSFGSTGRRSPHKFAKSEIERLLAGREN